MHVKDHVRTAGEVGKTTLNGNGFCSPFITKGGVQGHF